ncbi:hypothetical protein COU77_01125 [Candidatus Peregrinibacteria bacterium CG10_big_fil_rev_8_21_14_0_10_49_16]|nr:MAG: hypothetical protein COW95_00075 [Candidatus Peregrinibacteria bacterium CG22_combo_CG10-13_8_21_14_all_49_11]PIR52288.1 MAG: hypothetical protein COU77_01125 [Candidatus Peregrinibacteria bacterium CG10_big_fil_rev_8_21_14_0_10_49_16]
MLLIMNVQSEKERIQSLPTLSLDEMRDRVRIGHDLKVSVFVEQQYSSQNPQTLPLMRELSSDDFVVEDGDEPVARLENVHPDLLPKSDQECIARCREHIHRIRNRSDSLLRAIREKFRLALTHPIYRFIAEKRLQYAREVLVQIEFAMSTERGRTQAFFYKNYAHDIEGSTEFYKKAQQLLDENFAEQEIRLEKLAENFEVPLG